MSDNNCPCCGEELKVTKYQEEIWGHKETVEVDAKCKCGYHYNKAYGYETVEYPGDECPLRKDEANAVHIKT